MCALCHQPARGVQVVPRAHDERCTRRRRPASWYDVAPLRLRVAFTFLPADPSKQDVGVEAYLPEASCSMSTRFAVLLVGALATAAPPVAAQSGSESAAVVPTPPWVSVRAGVGGNWIPKASPARFKPSTQVLVAGGLTVPTGAWGLRAEALLSRELDVFASDCVGVDPGCRAATLHTAGVTLDILRGLTSGARPFTPRAVNGGIGVGLFYFGPRDTPSGDVASTVTGGVRAQLEGSLVRTASTVVTLSAQGVALPSLRGQRTTFAYVAIGVYRALDTQRAESRAP